MAKYRLKTKGKVDAIILEQNMDTVSDVLNFVYKNNPSFDAQLMPIQSGMAIRTNIGIRFAEWGDVIVKDNNGLICVYPQNIFNDLYEPTV